MKLLVSGLAVVLALSGCGAITDVGSKRDTFSVETEAGRAVCVVYVAESASIDCVWPGE